ncbi:transposase [Melittangium boletus]|uniref:transposase n=1 Tax=Melittangium boletus TaxID=83453 RepID=UPI000BB39B6A
MTVPSLNTLLPLLLFLRPVFTLPSFCRILTLFAGWVGTQGVHAVTESLVSAGVSGVRHHAAFHRFFSRARWSIDQFGRVLLLRVVALTPGPLRLALDDTLCTHKPGSPAPPAARCHLRGGHARGRFATPSAHTPVPLACHRPTAHQRHPPAQAREARPG